MSLHGGVYGILRSVPRRRLSAIARLLSVHCGKLPRSRVFPAVTSAKIIRQIAAEIRVHEQQVKAAVDLLDSGATVPFVARYRKEATGGLDDVQLASWSSGWATCANWRVARAVLKSIDEQGKLTPAASRNRGRAHQAGTRGPVPAVQAQAPHQGPDRPRGRHRAAGRHAVYRPDAQPAMRLRRFVQAEKARRRGFHHRCRRTRWCARHPVRALGRASAAGRNCVSGSGNEGLRQPASWPARTRTTRRGEFRTTSTTTSRSAGCLASRARGVPWAAAGNTRREAGAAGRAGAGQTIAGRGGQDRAASGLDSRRGPPTI